MCMPIVSVSSFSISILTKAISCSNSCCCAENPSIDSRSAHMAVKVDTTWHVAVMLVLAGNGRAPGKVNALSHTRTGNCKISLSKGGWTTDCCSCSLARSGRNSSTSRPRFAVLMSRRCSLLFHRYPKSCDLESSHTFHLLDTDDAQ